MFDYNATVEDVVDGDTIDVNLDLGFSVHKRDFRLRLRNVDTAEIFGTSHESEEYSAGITHKEFVEDWIQQAREDVDDEYPFIVDTYRQQRGSYGRYLGTIQRKSDDEILSEALLETFGEEVEYK